MKKAPIKLKKSRPTANPTRERILKAAQKLFVKQGFDGTSISQIAHLAKINQSLIYHHFGDKQQLWKQVKVQALSSGAFLPKNPEARPTGLRDFLEKHVRQRFAVYHNNPDLARLIAWQRLEPLGKELVGNSYFSPENWREIIIDLQKQKQIRQDLEPDVIISLVASIVPGIFMAYNPLLAAQDKYKSEECINQIIECLYRAFCVC